MQDTEEIAIIVVVGSILMLVLATFVATFFFLYQRRNFRYQQELQKMQEAYRQELLRSQLEIQEQTMQGVAQEIHDNVGQVLALVKINLNTLPETGDEKTKEKLFNTRELLNRAIADLRGLSKSLHGENRLGAGLAAALRAEVQGITNSGVVLAAFEQSGAELSLDPQPELLLFRITQELIHNALKHAESKNLRVSLDCSDGQFTLTVEDDGIGFDPQQMGQPNGGERGMGLESMRNRARLIGADFTIRSTVGQGTTAVLTLSQPSR